MPWTLSHPAAILPLRRLCPRYLSLPALVAGSVAPDLAFHVGRFDIGNFAHTFAGSIAVCIPAGLLLLLTLYSLRRPLWFLLPQPHRGALQPFIEKHPSWNGPALLAATASILLGAWTHSLWDSFTHSKTWMVDRIGLLNEPWLRIGTVSVPGYTVLQDLSTLLGAAALGAVYIAWLREQPRTSAEDGSSDRWRHWVLFSGAIVSVGIAIALTLGATAEEIQQVRTRLLLVQVAIYAVSSFAFLLGVYAALYFALRTKH
jgi:hypothetical protein